MHNENEKKKKTTWSYDQCIDAKYTFCVTFARGGRVTYRDATHLIINVYIFRPPGVQGALPATQPPVLTRHRHLCAAASAAAAAAGRQPTGGLAGLAADGEQPRAGQPATGRQPLDMRL